MKRLVLTILLLVVPCILFAIVTDPDEARLLTEIREISGESQGVAYMELANHRESKGEFRKAIDTWGILKKTHGKERAWNESSAPNHTYAELADFHIQRIRRVQNLLANPPKPPSLQLRKALAVAQEQYKMTPMTSAPMTSAAGYNLLIVPTDMDGDLIPELFVVQGEREKLGEAARMLLIVLEWDGKRYREAFRWQDQWQLGHPEQPHFKVIDEHGFGMYQVVVGFQPETDNSAAIQSNGREIIFAY